MGILILHCGFTENLVYYRRRRSQKTNRRELPKKRGAWTVCRFEGEGAWLKRGGGDTPNAH